MKTAFALLICLPSLIFSQNLKTANDIHFGLTTQAVISSLNRPGLNFMAFAEYKKHQIAFGPRLTYARNNFYPVSNITSRESKSFVLDFHYRYFVFDKKERFKTFFQFSAEINSRKDDFNFFYDHNATDPKIDASMTPQSAYGPTFNYSFNGRTNFIGSYLGLYLGIGEQIKIYKGLFATANVGFGKILARVRSVMTDMDKNEVVYRQNSDWFARNNIAMTFSLGLGFRF